MYASFKLQRLTPADVPLLRALNALFGEAFGDPEAYGAEPPSDSYLEALLGKEHVIALVAFDDGNGIAVGEDIAALGPHRPARLRKLMRNGDVVHDPRHARGFISNRLRRLAL